MAVVKALTSQNFNFYEKHLSVPKQYTLQLFFAVCVYRWLLDPVVLSGDSTDPSGSKQGKFFQIFVALL